MAAQTINQLIVDMRERVGDNLDDEFLSDTQWTLLLRTAARKLKSYCQVEDTEEIDGDGSTEYTIPEGLLNKTWLSLWEKGNSEEMINALPIETYRTHDGKIYLSRSIGAGSKIVVYYKKSYVLGTDELSEDALELLYKLAELEYLNHCIYRRADFQQWASLSRSDVSVNQLVLSKQLVKEDVADLASRLGDGTDVFNMGRY